MRRLALSPNTFRALAHDLSDFAADYLERLPQLPSYPPNISGLQTEHIFGGDIPLEGIGAAAFDSLPKVFEHSRPASFLIASSPFEDQLMFTTRMRDMAFKRSLKNAPLGTEVKTAHAMGSFTLHKNPAKAAVFLAGGLLQ